MWVCSHSVIGDAPVFVLRPCDAGAVTTRLSDQRSALALRVAAGGNGGAETIEIRVRRSNRAQRASLRVGPGRPPEIVLPAGAAVETADRLLVRHEGWLRRKLLWSQSVEAEAEAIGLLDPGLIWLEGEAHAVSAFGSLSEAGPEALEAWYRERARAVLTEATERISTSLAAGGLINSRPGRITIRDPRSRWGSCSARGNLSYSWRLVMMPPEVLEYVVCHEICHLQVHDHSPRFWRLVSAARPSWPEEAAWLRRYGPLIALHRPGTGVDRSAAALPRGLPPVKST